MIYMIPESYSPLGKQFQQEARESAEFKYCSEVRKHHNTSINAYFLISNIAHR
jgi:hypothetical protein